MEREKELKDCIAENTFGDNYVEDTDEEVEEINEEVGYVEESYDGEEENGI